MNEENTLPEARNGTRVITQSIEIVEDYIIDLRTEDSM